MKKSIASAAFAALMVLVVAFIWNGFQDRRNTPIANDGQAYAQVDRSDDQRLVAAIENLITDRVIDLPEDGQSYYLTVFTNTNPTPKERMLLSWFQSDTALASLKAQTHWNHYTPAVAMYKARFASAVPQSQFPAIMLQGPDAWGNHGKVYFKAQSHNLPGTPRELVAMIRDALNRPCPGPSPSPAPSPQPNPNPIPVIPDVGPHQPEPGPVPVDEQTNVLALAAVAALLAGAVTAYVELQKRTR